MYNTLKKEIRKEQCSYIETFNELIYAYIKSLQLHVCENRNRIFLMQIFFHSF